MLGSFADALGPAARRFLRPMRIVGRGGGSYLGFFCRVQNQQRLVAEKIFGLAAFKRVQNNASEACCSEHAYLLVLLFFILATLALLVIPET
jgi:hypothetical protein